MLPGSKSSGPLTEKSPGSSEPPGPGPTPSSCRNPALSGQMARRGTEVEGPAGGGSKADTLMKSKFRKICLTFCLGALTLPSLSAPAAAVEFRAPQVKAAFLYNFAKFVDWPAEAFSSADAPLVLGILGPDTVGTAAMQSLADKTVKGRPLEVRLVSRLEESKGCHVLFISAAEQPRLAWLLASLRRRSILTVSDIKHFAERGGSIGLTTVEHKIRFEINLEATREAGLVVSSQLLALATAIHQTTRRDHP